MKFKEMFGEAQWVSPNGLCDTPYIRGEFSLLDDIESAEIIICGLGFFELSLNGLRVGDEFFNPVNSDFHFYEEQRCYKDYGEILSHRIYCVKYDISQYLNRHNCIGVLLAPGWYKNDYRAPYGEVKLCFVIKITLKNGKKQEILSGDWLKWTQSPILKYSFYHGELQDYNAIRLVGWNTVGFIDDKWHNLEVVEVPETEYYIQDCPADKIIRYIEPKFVCETENGYVYDMGENISGTPIIRSKSSHSEKLTIKCSERLNENGTIEDYTNHGQYSTFITDGSDRTYRLIMTWYGFRYCEISKNAEMVSCAVIHSDIEVTSGFKCDVPLLNWMYETYIRTQLVNMHNGIPSDCPHIERRGYTGDGQLLCECGMLMLDSKRFYAKWIEDIFDCQDTISGHVQNAAPYFRSGGGPGGWGCAIIEVPYIYYKMYGDISVLERSLPKTLKYFEYLDAHSDNDLVVSDQEGLWCLGEWCTLEKVSIPEPFVNTYFYIKSIDRLLEVCDVLGEKKLKKELEIKRKVKVSAIIRHYFNEATGNFAENIQGANAFACDLGLGDERTLQNLVTHYQENKRFDTGIFGTEILTKILFKNGYEQLAFNLLTSNEKYSFADWMNSGCTTFPETWTYQRSQNHPMFGAITKYFFIYILGIVSLEAGYKKLLIKPCFIDNIHNAEGYITTQNGKVYVGYKRTEKTITVIAEIPDGVSAIIDINGETQELTSGKNELIFDRSI